MPQLADFISRIFSTGRTQGLSGGAEVVGDPDPAAAFYASRLRRHQAEGDFVLDPALLWNTTSYQGSRGGLRAHIQAERGDGIASFTDVLVVVSQADARRAATQPGEAWTERAARQLGEGFSDFCIQERFEMLYGTRPLRFRLVADGGKEMLSQSFGLAEGEFVTGLLPNLYVGPAMRSRPVLAVHLNMPGVWQGYREVGRLFSDQIVFTLGRHWLDNYAHPGLREPGIYRLQQYPDGSLVHVISPELQDRYFVRSDQTESGPSVLTIAELDGRPVAFLVLAVVESQTQEMALPQPRKAAEPAAAPTPAGPPPPLAPVPSARNATIPPGQQQRTIIPDADDTRILTLHERGALLQKVHFSNFMEGYDVYLGPKAQVATSAASMQARATIQVRSGRVSIVAHDHSVSLDGKALDRGAEVMLTGVVKVEIDGASVEFRDLTGVKAEGWPYLGELRRPGAGSYLDFGAVFQLGRDRRSKVRLPDEPHNENIAWLPSVGGGATIRSRTGDIQKSKFYTDSIMVASTHAEVDLRAEPVLRSLARHCYTFVRRGEEVLSLFPTEGAGGVRELVLKPNDELLVGNCLFQVAYPPPKRASITAPVSLAAVPKFSAKDIAAAVDEPVKSVPSFATIDPVAPAALGHAGPAPRPVRGPRGGAPKNALSEVAMVDATDLPEPVSARGARSRAPRVAAPMLLNDEQLVPVVSVEERDWQRELARPARLVQCGWSVHGHLTLGNHRGVDMIVPEVRAFPDQPFLTLDYVRVYARGQQARMELIQEGEAAILQGDKSLRSTESAREARIVIVRRDQNLEPDFDVTLRFAEGRGLPDPRAQLLEIDLGDRLVAALFTTGLPERSDRQLTLGPITATLRFDGGRATISDYLTSYRTGASGFVPFFYQEGAKPWRTMPEDGTAVSITPGDRILAGANLYRFEVA